jgi:general stress protein 26
MAERVEKNSAEAIEQLQELVSKVRIAMMATINAWGVLSCRPMTTISAEDDGSLWFMTNESSGKVSDQHNNHIVHLMYSDPSSNTYFHVYGSSEEVTDRTMIRKLWSPLLKAWYPQGPDDPA